MTRAHPRRTSFGGLAAGLWMLTAAAASADYKASYIEGIKAIDNKDWAAAITALRAAAEEKSVEGERVLIYGMRFKPYLPHYYLGLAYFNTGNCQSALKALAESERQGAVRQLSEYRTLQSIQEQCRGQGVREPQPTPPAIPTRVPEVPPAVREAEAEIKRSEAIASAIARSRNEPDSSRVFQDPAVRQGENKANVDLVSARALLTEARATGDASRIGAAKETAQRARQEFEALQRLVAERRDRIQREALDRQAKERERESREREAALERQARENEAREKQAALERRAREEEARKRQAALERESREKESRREAEAKETRAALSDVHQRIREAQQLLVQVDGRPPSAPDLGGPRKDLESAVEKARRAGPTTSLSDLRRLSDALGASTASLKKASTALPVPPPERRPPPALFEAATAYFQADYGKAARLLERAQFDDSRATAQARLLRGAARFGIFVTSGGTDEQLRLQAIEDVRECIRLDPKIVVSTRAFSPKFVEFFRKNAPQNGG